jgi:hypothetical protein
MKIQNERKKKNQEWFLIKMLSSNARSILVILFKSNQTDKTVIPSILSSFSQLHNYKSITPNNGQGWTDALISEVNDEQTLYHLDMENIIDAVKTEYNAESILIAPMIYSIECVKDTSNDPENDVFFAVAFRLEEKLDQFPQD